MMDVLKEALDLFNERDDVYGNNYERVGRALNQLFDGRVILNGVDDLTKFYLLVTCVSKLGRYAVNLEKGGHRDSAIDLVNYAAMLASVTE